MLEQLLRLARLDPLARLPNPVEVDLAELARQGSADVLQSVDARDIRPQTAGSPLLVHGDAELLQIVLRNLLDNALRYTPADSRIHVFARRQGGGELSLGVADDGPGVPPTELPRLVERFYRGHGANAEGSGLGLAIVQRIAELHDARFEVENLPAGGFTARLRWCRSPAA